MAEAATPDVHAGAVPDSRCGYVHDVSTLSDLGAATCWRPTYQEESSCIWHAELPQKEHEQLAAHPPGPGERLDGALLDNTSIDGVDWFEECVLIGAEFSMVDAHHASFVGADLRSAVFDDVSARYADFSDVNLEGASLTGCDFRHAEFVGARIDQASFVQVRVSQETSFGLRSVYEHDLARDSVVLRALRRPFRAVLGQDGETTADADTPTDDPGRNSGFRQHAQAAIWSYREFQRLFENNGLPLEARSYYLHEKNLRRLLAWDEGDYARALKAEGSRWVTGYGMNPWRVLGTALAVILVCALLYPTTGGLQETVTVERGDPDVLNESAPGNTTVTDSSRSREVTWAFGELGETPVRHLVGVYLRSVYFSTITFTTLGYGDIQPVGDTARTVAGLESLSGALLTALLVFVLTRRIS